MYQRILVPIDGSATSEYALNEVIKFVQQQNAQIELVHVLEDVGYFDNEDYLNYSELVDSMRRNGERILKQSQNKLQQVGITAEIKLMEARGERIANVIVTEAKSNCEFDHYRYSWPIRLQSHVIR